MPDEVWISLTSTPVRVGHIHNLLTDLLKQVDQQQQPVVNRIVLNLPLVSMKGQPYIITPELQTLIDTHPQIILNQACKDIGPLTKLLPTLELISEPDTIIITLDDDVRLPADCIAHLVAQTKQYPNAALSYTGWCFNGFPFICTRIFDRPMDQPVDWVEGSGAILYRRRYLLDGPSVLAFAAKIDGFNGNKEFIMKHDDQILNGYLSERHIQRIVVGSSLSIAPKCNGLLQPMPGTLSHDWKFSLQVFWIARQLYNRGLYTAESQQPAQDSIGYMASKYVALTLAIVIYFILFVVLIRQFQKKYSVPVPHAK